MTNNDKFKMDWDHLQPLVMDQIQDAITITDLEGRIIYVNDAECRLIGRTREDLLGASVFVYGEDQARGSSQHNIIEQTLQQGSWRGEVINYTAQGEELILDCRTQLVYDPQGNAVAMCGIATDITRRKRMEQTLLASENNLAITLDSIGDAVIATDTSGMVMRMNPVAERLTGWDLAEARGQPLRKFFRICDARTREPLNDPVTDVLQTGEIAGLANNTLLLARNGAERQIADSAAPIRDAGGHIIGVVLVFRDISDEYRMREMLRESEARYKALFMNANDGILVADAESRQFLYANPAICRLLGYKADELIKLTPHDIHPPEVHRMVDDKFTLLLRQAQKVHDIPCRRKDGSIVYVDISGAPMVLDGRLCNVGFFIDTTERKQAEDQALANHRQLLAVMDANPDPIYVSDPETYEVLHVNRAMMEAFGEPGARKCYEHFQDRQSPCPFCTNHLIFGDNFGQAYIWDFHNPKSNRWYRCLDRGIVWPDGRKARYEMAVDITALKRAQADLRESVENLSITLKSIGDGVIATDAAGLIVNMNPVAEQLCGWDLDEARGLELDKVFNIINADTGAAVQNPVHKVLTQGRILGLANHTVLISRAGVWHQIADTAAPIKNNHGEISGVVLVFSDVTDKYRAEKSLRESEERFRRLFSNALDGVAIHEIILDDKQQPIDYVYLDANPAFTKATGWRVEDILGQRITAIVQDKSMMAPLLEIYGNVALQGQPASFEYYFPLLKRHYSINAFQVGPGRFATVFQDITERKRSEYLLKKSLAEKDTLLRELYHRTKNNMQVICSMLGLQAAYNDSPEVGRVFKDTVARIQAMALVHQKLCQAQDLSRIDLHDYISDLTDLLFKSYNISRDKIRFELEVAPLTVLIDIAVPCGLIVNELTVNSLKYAFVGREQGIIRMRISVEDDTIIMDYADDGVGVPDNFDFRGQKSLGLQSIFALVEQQLQGRVEFRNRPGLGCRVTFVNRVYKPRV